jgi:hypothetical protein
MAQLFENEKKITFVPDYSATIRDDCTYLEITAHTYLLAFKSTLISRNRSETSVVGDNFHIGTEIPINKITSAGYLEEDVALVRSNGSLESAGTRTGATLTGTWSLKKRTPDSSMRKRANSDSSARLIDTAADNVENGTAMDHFTTARTENNF